jgi:uncharacterized membrane protein
MADASLALAERRADDYKRAAERLGVEVPTNRQLRGLKLMGLIAPPSSAGSIARVRGVLLIIALIVTALALAFGIVYGIGSAAGGLSWQLSIFWGFILLLVVLVVLVILGRRRQRAAQAKRADEAAARAPR